MNVTIAVHRLWGERGRTRWFHVWWRHCLDRRATAFVQTSAIVASELHQLWTWTDTIRSSAAAVIADRTAKLSNRFPPPKW